MKTKIKLFFLLLVFALSFRPLFAQADLFNAEMLVLTPGRTTSELNLTWYGNTADGTSGRVMIAERQAMSGDDFPRNATVVRAAGSEASEGNISHKATITRLKPDTEYVYAVSNDGRNYSRRYNYRTPPAGDFAFVVVGDAQLTDPSVSPTTEGVPGGYMENNHRKTTRQGWQETVDSILRTVPTVSLIVSTGDQVDRNVLPSIGRPEDTINEHEPKYANFLAPEALRSIPIAPGVGNHESRSNRTFLFHYNLPNERIVTGSSMINTGSTGAMQIVENRANYYYLYNNVLFVSLNTSARVRSVEEARAYVAVYNDVLRAATRAHRGKYDWLIVTHHKTTAGLADHAADRDVQFYVEAGFEKLMADYSVDAVFAGHDHIYSRSFPMTASTGAGSINGVIFNSNSRGNITKGDGTLFFTLNSSSGQKYYAEFVPDIKNNIEYPYLIDGSRGSENLMRRILPWSVNVYRQRNKPMFTEVQVTGNSITIKTYEIQDNLSVLVVDEVTVSKN